MDTDVLAEVRRLFAPEEGARETARSRVPDTIRAPSPEVGALLRWTAITCGAAAAVEVGGAAGLSALWLLDGLRPTGVVTSIESDAHAHGLATSAYTEAQVSDRVRAILGQPDAVLPRLSDGAYDLMLLQSSPAGWVDALGHARRLLRPGGVLVARGVLRHGEHADALARFLEELAADGSMPATVLPFDDGLALATRAPDPASDAGAS